MRIVAGEFRGHGLATPKSNAVRPTSDRLRETIFDILIHRFGDPVSGARVLDLFAGTGALGLEALSRGASWCLFVDDSVEGRGLIRTNVEALRQTGRTKIFRRDATRLGPCPPGEPYDLLFADPPYNRGLAEAALAAASTGGWLAPGATCVVEEAASAEFAAPPRFALEDERLVGDSRLMFLRYAPLDPAE